jgi:Domain of unknown function (DUF4282)
MDPSAQVDAKGFFRSLFDIGFTSLITTKIIRFVYALLLIVYSFVALIFFIVGLASGKPRGIFFALIVVPIAYLIYLVFARIWMEFLIVVFRIGEDVHAIRMQGFRVQGSGPSQTPPPPGQPPPQIPPPWPPQR